MTISAFSLKLPYWSSNRNINGSNEAWLEIHVELLHDFSVLFFPFFFLNPSIILCANNGRNYGINNLRPFFFFRSCQKNKQERLRLTVKPVRPQGGFRV